MMVLNEVFQACVTWKHATYALAGLLLSSGGGMVWLDSELDEMQAQVNAVEQIKEDVQIIKECLIKKECG
jgi:hypothetical protein